ncbi:plasmid replication protein [Buchnera aphidicola]|uniref:plasmid replication protein n=1 Tax=Buchnera aphidicola TaxID=9 RepID=UPI0016516E66|nr:plasmid replication protein [Buchnera aphidicola]
MIVKTKKSKFKKITSSMSLFNLPPSNLKKNEYSNTIEIYDSIPKYIWNLKKIYTNESNAIIIRKTKIRGKNFLIKIKPAIIEKKNFKTTLIYPGQREEIIEDALRKIALYGKDKIVQGKAGVIFTLYELQKELTKTGHGYNLNEIKEGIEVCGGAVLEFMTEDKKTFISSSFFPLIKLTKKSCLYTSHYSKCYVQFNPLVHNSIIDNSFKQYNYTICMQIHSPLARYMYKRMSHYWTQAHEKLPYTPSLISFLNYSSRESSKRISENIRAMKNALDLLIKKKIINYYQKKEKKNGKKIIDIKYIITPHANFINQIVSSNKKTKK